MESWGIVAAMALTAACAVIWVAPARGQREFILPQIDLPHAYYYREMYLPQLTTGPSGVSWSPDSSEVIYSMAGALWRQGINSRVAQQLTDGDGYDYQPDWSPDGKRVVYCSYQKDAIELWMLNLQTGAAQQITSGGAVNVEPRWSPDGKKIAFVSTQYNKRFHIFAAEVADGKLRSAVRVTGETKSTLPRYYYSAYDTEISPVWARDGQNILFVANRGHIYGSGGIWKMKAEVGAEAREIHYEETTWRARPDISPDGSRVVYSSYVGRNWHQLWTMPANGGDAIAISYGEWDETGARWSPNGKTIAFISNRHGNTELWLQDVVGGAQRQVGTSEKHYLNAVGKVRVTLRDGAGQPVAGRVSIVDARGKAYAPENAWMYADDGHDRAQGPFEAHYFHSAGDAEVEVPAGNVTVEVMHGFESAMQRCVVEVRAGETSKCEKVLGAEAWGGLDGAKWVSSDLHVHMNYAGSYHNTPKHLVEQADAENLALVNNLIVNKEQRFPDIAYSGAGVDGASNKKVMVVHEQEYHTSYWGHLGLLNMRGGILLPGYVGYPNTAAASLWPMNADVADEAHARGGLVGYVHPFDEEPQPVSKPGERLTDELPVDVALGKVDYMEIVGFSDHRATAAVWYRLLNLGFRIPAGAGTDAMANFASLRGPVGMNRVYARVGEGWKVGDWMAALKDGKTFATNGPLLDFSLGDERIGGEVKLGAAAKAVNYRVALRSLVPLDHFEIVCNGQVAADLRGAIRERDGMWVAQAAGNITLRQSGWCMLRAGSDAAEYPVLDKYVYATTSPIYVTVGGKRPRSTEDAKYFAAWIDRVTEATAGYPDWNSAAERKSVMERLMQGRAVFAAME